MTLRAIPGQPGYLCSEDGRIFSMKTGSPVEMKAFRRGRRGHLGVNLTHGGKFRLHSVHRLIALTWIGPQPSPKHLVMHGDDDPTNNACSNLSWGLPIENSAQMVQRCRSARGERVFGSKLTAKQVLAIRVRMDQGDSPSLIARELGMSLSNICDIKKRRVWKHI